MSDADEYLLPTYDRLSVQFDRGEGVYLYDQEGTQYIDLLGGIAVNVLGYRHPALVEAGREAVNDIQHVSNLFPIQPQLELAKALSDITFNSRAFFCNSGAESIEAAIKFARKYSQRFGNDGRTILTFENSFHGRTLGALTATGQTKYQDGFEPLPEGFRLAQFNDIESVRSQVDSDVCGILVEAIQGEGGVIPAEPEFLDQLREFCDRENILLIFDEVQAGTGRTGQFLAADTYGVRPDLAALAKGLGGGYPIGCLLASDTLESGLQSGDHASTFGGNPFVTKMALTVLETIRTENLMTNAEERGKQLREGLKRLSETFESVGSPRGRGLMLAVELDDHLDAGEVMRQALDDGLVIGTAGDNSLRFVPPLVLEENETDQALERLEQTLKTVIGA
ncbi:MAG: aspartate aminotransferase family protein [bacterium]